MLQYVVAYCDIMGYWHDIKCLKYLMAEYEKRKPKYTGIIP